MRGRFEWLGWAVAGAIVALAVVCVVFKLQPKGGIGARMAAHAQMRTLIDQIRGELAHAGEAEKSATLATGDEESTAFAKEARAATARVEARRVALGALVEDGGNANERSLFDSFTSTFVKLRQIDDELLTLAVENTNVKASALAIGAGADAARTMDEALQHVILDARTLDVVRAAAAAQAAVLRIQALVFPHIAEASDANMDALEARMADEERTIRESLRTLPESDRLKSAKDAYARFSSIKAQILTLSRRNTNVRSLALSLDGKRKATLACAEALDALSHAIDEVSLRNNRPHR